MFVHTCKIKQDIFLQSKTLRKEQIGLLQVHMYKSNIIFHLQFHKGMPLIIIQF